MRMHGPWKAMLTVVDDAQPKGAGQNLRMQWYPWASCSSLLRGVTVHAPKMSHTSCGGSELQLMYVSYSSCT